MMESLPDYYGDLGVDRGASQKVIEKTYHRRVNRMRNSHAADAHEELPEVEAAYSILRDPGARGEYEHRLRDKERGQNQKL